MICKMWSVRVLCLMSSTYHWSSNTVRVLGRKMPIFLFNTYLLWKVGDSRMIPEYKIASVMRVAQVKTTQLE